MMPLNNVNMGMHAQIDDIQGSERICKKIMEMGLNKGMVIQMVRNDVGPLIIKIGESRLAIGRGMAQRVIVKEM